MKTLLSRILVVITVTASFSFYCTTSLFAKSCNTSVLDTVPGLFDSKEILNITLEGEMGKLLKDKSKDPDYYPLSLSYTNENAQEITLLVEVKTRGNFRRLLGNCEYLPLMIRFPKDDQTRKNTIFKEQKKMKLVVPCKGEKYVIYEQLVYELYNLVTPMSFRTRLVKVILENKKGDDSFIGFLLEEEDQLASRNEMIAVEHKLKPRHMQQETFLKMAVFEYLVGNTDWSIQYLQNIKLLAVDSASKPYPVPYDFDHAGIVSAPYARPAEALQLRSVRDRRYRGHCIQDMQKFEKVISFYQQLKPDIYQVYTDHPMLSKKYIEKTVKYLDRFFEILDDPKKWHRALSYPCDPRGTGNVVIQGIQEH